MDRKALGQVSKSINFTVFGEASTSLTLSIPLKGPVSGELRMWSLGGLADSESRVSAFEQPGGSVKVEHDVLWPSIVK